VSGDGNEVASISRGIFDVGQSRFNTHNSLQKSPLEDLYIIVSQETFAIFFTEKETLFSISCEGLQKSET
jgi:hypothetical protein